MTSSKELIQQYIKSYETGNPENINAFLHLSHMYYPPGGGKPSNLEGRIRSEQLFFKAFSNIQTTVEDQIAESDKVASRISMHCTHTGEYHGIPPTNKHIIITYTDITMIQDNKIIKEWAEFDMLNLLNQLH
ncbi:MAG TPA: ester cyclase [Methanocella sp.]|nr:ester cyclase [Methanocella sp.]